MIVVQTSKYAFIDSLRGYAVLMVLFTHLYAFVGHNDPEIGLGKFWVQCRFGVMLFFMISALTLFLSFQQKANKEVSPVKNFFLRRLFRIAPLFYLVAIGSVFFGSFSIINIITTFTFTNGFIPNILMTQIVRNGWTIAVEMMFYCLVPILFYIITNINKAIILFIGLTFTSVILKFLVFRYTQFPQIVLIEYTYYWLPAQLPIFMLGIILYFALFKAGNTPAPATSLYMVILSYLLVFCGMYFFVVMCYSTKLFITENIAFSFSLMLIIIGMAINNGLIFNNKAAQFLGKVSYSFYLLHGIFIEIFYKYLEQYISNNRARFFIGVIIILCVTSLISYITYSFIEQPFQKMGSKLIEKLEHKRLTKKDLVIL